MQDLPSRQVSRWLCVRLFRMQSKGARPRRVRVGASVHACCSSSGVCERRAFAQRAGSSSCVVIARGSHAFGAPFSPLFQLLSHSWIVHADDLPSRQVSRWLCVCGVLREAAPGASVRARVLQQWCV